MERRVFQQEAERDAVLGLWGIEGIGPVSLACIEEQLGVELGQLVDVPVLEWIHQTELRPAARADLATVPTLREMAVLVRAAAERQQMEISFAGDDSFPEKLLDIPDPPPVLFFRGRIGRPRKCVAVVGSRHPDTGSQPEARKYVRALARAGLCIISGAAFGMDQIAHEAALEVGGETWAFVGSSLDELDPWQQRIARQILAGGGRILTEYPPATRANRARFPRRNRLISGAADAVLILRAGRRSGTLHTANHAIAQGKPLFAVPGDPWNPAAAGSVDLLRSGRARAFGAPQDIFDAFGIVPERQAEPAPAGRTVDELPLSASARRAWKALGAGRRGLEQVQEASRMEYAMLVSALTELELAGLAVQHPGRVYEKV